MAKKQREIEACMNCGSTKIDFLYFGIDPTRIASAGLGGIRFGIAKCKECGSESVPIIFKTKKNHEKFLRYRQKRREISKK